jgi:hypothetical protein
MPPKREAAAAAAVSSDSDGSSCDDDALTWQDDIDWENCAATRGLNPSLCVRTRILISLAASRMVTLEQRRQCWQSVGDFPLNEKLVLDAMGTEEEGPRRTSRNAVRNAAESVRDIAFDSQDSDGTMLRKVKKVVQSALCHSQIQPIALSAKANKSGAKRANNVTQQGTHDALMHN